jgi:hypothetical protein
MGARSYAPQFGWFLQPDPVPGGSANTYGYTFEDPANSSDPSGELTHGFSGWLKAQDNQEAKEVAEREVARETLEREVKRRAREAQAAAEAAAAAATPGEAAAVPLGATPAGPANTPQRQARMTRNAGATALMVTTCASSRTRMTKALMSNPSVTRPDSTVAGKEAGGTRAVMLAGRSRVLPVLLP